MTKKKRAPAPKAHIVETPKRKEFGEPPWHSRDRVIGNPHKMTVRRICADNTYHLPAFQRGSVWTPEQQVAYCNSVFQGLPTAHILLWERFIDGRYINIVLDGQQRLTALGADLLRPDGSRNPDTGAFFDHATGVFTTVPGRWSDTMRTLSKFDFHGHMETTRVLEDGEEEDLQRLWYWRIFAHDRVSNLEIVSYVLDHMTTPEQVVAAFRSINQPGVPISDEEIERLISSCAPEALLGVAP